MKRWTIRVVVFLLLGAIVNVAVAWGCAARGGSGSGIIVEFAESSIRQGGFWLVRTESARGAQRVHSNRLVDSLDGWTRGDSPPDLIPAWSTIPREVAPDGPKLAELQMQDASGWPMLSMRCTFLRVDVGVDLITAREVVGGYELPPRIGAGRLFPTSTLRALPYIPIPLGFLVNTLFYAAFMGLPIVGALEGRRVFRRVCGHCIKCGYDLRGAEHEVCPECGVTVVD